MITLPKLQIPAHGAALADVLDAIEPKLGLPAGSLRFEIMIETPQSISTPRPLPALGRRVPRALRRAPTWARTTTPRRRHHRRAPAHDAPGVRLRQGVMQASLGGTGFWLSDGATNVMPVGDFATVHAAWRLQAMHIRHSLVGGFYQGWDLHPAQLVARYAAVYAFYLESLPAATARLRTSSEGRAGHARGRRVRRRRDRPGPAQLLPARPGCGAISETEALATRPVARGARDRARS